MCNAIQLLCNLLLDHRHNAETKRNAMYSTYSNGGVCPLGVLLDKAVDNVYLTVGG